MNDLTNLIGKTIHAITTASDDHPTTTYSATNELRITFTDGTSLLVAQDLGLYIGIEDHAERGVA